MPSLFLVAFVLVLVLVIAGFVTVFASIGRQAARARAERRANLAAPVTTSPATVTSRRTEVTGGGESRAVTTYHATFEFPDGTRREFTLTGEQYAQLAEGDRGLLTTQGTWFQSFRRDRMIQDRP
ncbi:MAG: DUF2500 domain-containing protein [Dermatophilaceae bacterium]